MGELALQASFLGTPELTGVVCALALSILYVSSGYFAAKIALSKDTRKFITIVMGGMVLRLFITIGIVGYFLAILKLHVLSFALTFVISYFFLQMAEIIYINRQYNTIQKRKKIHLLQIALL